MTVQDVILEYVISDVIVCSIYKSKIERMR